MTKMVGGLMTTQTLGISVEERMRRLEERINEIFRPDGTINLSSMRRVEINVAGSVVVVDASGITLRGSGRLELQGNQKVVVSASAVDVSTSRLKMHAGLVEATGTVKAETVQAKSIVGRTYTPGAGNVW